MRLALLVPAGFLAGAVAARVALLHHPAAIVTDLAQPLPVVTYWKGFGAQMFGALALAIAIGCAGYVAVLRSQPQSGKLVTIAATCAAACLAALTFPVIFSSDVYAYAGYGYLALHGISPYAHVRIEAHAPLLDAMVWQWGNPPPMCVYGPAFVLIAKGMVALLMPLGTAAPLWGLRILACAALVACAPLAHAAFAPLGVRVQRAAAAGIALNPLAIWNAASGHNDILALAVVLAGYVLAARSRSAAGAIVAVLGALIKAPAIVAAAGVVVSTWRDRTRRFDTLAAALGALCAVFVLSFPLEMGLETHVAATGKYAPQFSPQYVLASVMPVGWAAAATAVATLACFIAGTRRLLKGEAGGAACVALAAWCAIPNPYPWYAIWILPVAFLAWETPASWAVIGATIAIGLRYYPEATWPQFSAPAGVAITFMEFFVPVAFLIAYMRHLARPDRPGNHTKDPRFARLRSQ